MPANATTQSDARAHVLTGVEEQISELQPGLEQTADLSVLLAQVNQLQQLLNAFPADATITGTVTNDVLQPVSDVQSGSEPLSTLGNVLASLYVLQGSLTQDMQKWMASGAMTTADSLKLQGLVLAVIASVNQVLVTRPDVAAIMDDLTAIKSLGGGPADAVAYHDFNVLQIAFRSVWMNAFDADLQQAAAQLYAETARFYDDSGLGMPQYQAISDVTSLIAFMNDVSNDTATAVPVPADVAVAFPNWTGEMYAALSPEQQSDVAAAAARAQSASSTPEQKADAINTANLIMSQPAGTSGRIATLITEMASAIAEPYAFDVFAPDSFNYGLLITYRQEWTPGPYQAGDLVATIPLAPGETRKFTSKRIVKSSRAEREIAKSMSTSSLQQSETSRAEAEITQKATSATNFKMTSSGSFNIGIGSIDATTSFTADQQQQSSMSKKAFHEATLKAAEEYRQERSLQVDTSSTLETEETSSGEIANPNNEITVTYLFYELQRRYAIREYLYRARPVILVAQDVPSPHEIDEAWLIQYQWIISRALLDDLFRPALTYLTTGFAGDEVSTEVLRASWSAQQQLVASLEALVTDQQAMRDSLRESLINTTFNEDVAKVAGMPVAAKVFTLGLAPDPSSMEADRLDAVAKMTKARLQYVEDSLADAQKKLTDASGAFTQATAAYSTAIQRQYSRQVAIDQLRVHVKQNIMYYMQAIWDSEPPDQRFFRLYNKKVFCPDIDRTCSATIDPVTTKVAIGGVIDVAFNNICAPALGADGGVGGTEHALVDVADLDNPLGYKGNYIIFPLVDSCYLTTYMLSSYINNYLGIIDPDGSDDFDAETFDDQWTAAEQALNAAIAADDATAQSQAQATLDQLKATLTAYISAVRHITDEIIVPTGQLFIEALPGSRPILEDFKLEHRFQDVRKVKAEVRHAELENLRLAARLVEGQTDTTLLADPEIDKKVIVAGGASLVAQTV
jgi:hypothetical protein